ncbi:hypothetical protein PABG_06978 [Paracoccidioides brasiliensis Pb03]|nr:hypothetical protein PABG_06978 [Paracoccidioides brasiliensis Pb03]
MFPLVERGSNADVLANMDANMNRILLPPPPPSISLSRTWHVLGPFNIGTREATWGADPLEILGGFRNISFAHDPNATFASALGLNGTVHWSVLEASELVVSDDGSAKVTLDLGFPDVDWAFFQSIYGWAALQYQAWARGSITVSASGADGGRSTTTNAAAAAAAAATTSAATVAIFTDGLLEIWIDGEPYFGGDFYTYRRAPILMNLAAGEHVIDLRFVRDVRAMGGVGEPRVRAVVEVKQLRHFAEDGGDAEDGCSEVQLDLDAGSLLVAEVVEGKLISPFASVIVRNYHEIWVEVTDIRTVDDDDVRPAGSGPTLSLLHSPLTLAPFQSRPMSFRIDFCDQSPSNFTFQFSYKFRSPDDDVRIRKTKGLPATLTQRTISEAQKFTFLHTAAVVSYAILLPPLNTTCNSVGKHNLPVLLSLHGAGLEAADEQVRHMLDASYGVCAWIVFPTGGTSWSGDDWHTWGSADVHAAVAAIPDWMEAVGWEGPGVALEDWIVSGHSNGGQGTWFLLTHQSDKIIAAAPVSGYSSIENYVPYTMWHPSDLDLTHLLRTSLQSFKHELLIPNLAGTPILQQHGSADDNVPAYHSRLLHQLIQENNWQSTYHELPDAGHWFTGVLTTPPLIDFYSHHASRRSYDDLLPKEFSFVVPSSGDMGSRGGIVVDQLSSPDRYGHIRVTREGNRGGLWHLKTRNVHRFHLLPGRMRVVSRPVEIRIDDPSTGFTVPGVDDGNATWFVKDEISGSWTMSSDGSWRDDLSQRYGRQNGAMDAILRTRGRFLVRICASGGEGSGELERVAVQVSRNLLQYFAADAEILPATNCANSSTGTSTGNGNGNGNIMTLALTDALPPSLLPTFPISISKTHITIQPSRPKPTTLPIGPNLGAIFLRPLPHQRLELVIWGADVPGLRQASRLVPLLTGVGQPDFVVLGERARWMGVAGAVSGGFLDWRWRRVG